MNAIKVGDNPPEYDLEFYGNELIDIILNEVDDVFNPFQEVEIEADNVARVFDIKPYDYLSLDDIIDIAKMKCADLEIKIANKFKTCDKDCIIVPTEMLNMLKTSVLGKLILGDNFKETKALVKKFAYFELKDLANRKGYTIPTSDAIKEHKEFFNDYDEIWVSDECDIQNHHYIYKIKEDKLLMCNDMFMENAIVFKWNNLNKSIQ